MKIAGAPEGYGPRSGIGSQNPAPRPSAMISATISPIETMLAVASRSIWREFLLFNDGAVATYVEIA